MTFAGMETSSSETVEPRDDSTTSDAAANAAALAVAPTVTGWYHIHFTEQNRNRIWSNLHYKSLNISKYLFLNWYFTYIIPNIVYYLNILYFSKEVVLL